MNARTIRRAMERKALKDARKALKGSAVAEEATLTAAAAASFSSFESGEISTSEARLTANRQNAKLSTGPKTLEGKSVSSKNAVKTALTGRTVLLPTDDAERYEAHCQAYLEELAPVGQRETILTQSLADNAWRVERIASFEMAIFAKGRTLLADAHQNEPAAIRTALIEHDIYQANERELRNLHLQEARLRRQRDRDNEELRRLQAERHAAARQQLELAAQACKQARSEQKPFDPAALGFVFSNEEIERFLAAGTPPTPSLKRLKAA